jgi:hypothetical protein
MAWLVRVRILMILMIRALLATMSRRLVARGALVVRMVVLEGMRRMRLVVVVMARLVVMVVRMLRVVVTEWFCRFLFVCFLYA